MLQARGRLVLLPVGLEAGGEEATHPLAHRLAPALKRLAVRTTLEWALSGPRLRLGGADLPREAIERRPLPQATRHWPAPGALPAKLAGRTESATSLTRLFQCQLKWSLHDLARLRPARGRAIPDTHQLLGTLAHALSKELFEAGPPPEPEVAATRASELLESLIEQRAVPLLQPAHAVDLMDARLRLPRAMGSLARLLRENALEVVATELYDQAQPAEGPPLQGAIDLLAHDPAGDRVVVDLKWTRSRTYRRDELREGRAVQLAVYGVMTSPDRPRGGYFLLRDGEFLTPRGKGLAGTQVPVPYDLRETWQHVVTTWRTWTTLAERGELHATGVDDEEQAPLEGLPLVLEPRCDWCDFATICRLRGSA
ncbi:MAG: PD-(D/E)XK nuclease family protein [Trueperaceae bacterium]|nr:PD-(D/E)XK nuclease family protein [Trueperaceae bacterium]